MRKVENNFLNQRPILSLLIVCFLLGCSSSPVDENQTVQPVADVTSMPTAAEMAEEREPERPQVAPVEMPQSDQQKLSQAARESNWSQVRKLAQAVLMKNPKDVKALNAMGLAYFRQNQPKAAIYFFSRALKSAQGKEKGQLLNNLALAQLLLKEEKEALKTFRQSVQNSQGDPVVAANLGSLYVRLGNGEKASVALDVASSQFSQDSKVLHNLGSAFAMRSLYKEAAEKYRAALKITPSQKETLFNLSYLLIERMKNPAEGREALQKLKFFGVPNELLEATNELEKKVKALK